MKRIVLMLGIFLLMCTVVSAEKIDEQVLESLESKADKVEVIVELKEGAKNTSPFSAKNNQGNYGIKEGKIRGKSNKSFSAEITLSDLKKLSENSEVESVIKMGRIYAVLQDAVGIVNATPTQNLQSSGINLTGSTQSVCIIDSGINTTHPDIAARYLGGYDFVDDDATPEDGHGHGTHIAGIIAASGGITGIAPSTGIVALRVLNNAGGGSPADLVSAIDWCVNNASTFNITTISMSLGCNGTIDGYTSSCDAISDGCWNTALASSINAATANNISVVASTGNHGNSTAISSPACIQNTIPVSSTDNNDAISSFSDRNSLVKLFAPGSDINSTRWDPTQVAAGCSASGSKYMRCSGTSMAAPVVSAAITIVRQYLDLIGQTKTPSQIEDVLYDTGVQFTEGSNNFSRIDIHSAILSIDGTGPNVTLISPADDTINPIVNQTFTCNATDWQLSNMTLQVWNSTELYYNTTSDLTGTENQTSFNLTNMAQGSYSWNCLATDNKSNSGYAATNYTLIIAENISSCANLNVSGNYALDSDITSNGTCMNIETSGVYLDCNGHSITGNGTGWGVNLSDFNQTTVINCNIANFTQGISKESFTYSENITIKNNRINTSANVNQSYGIQVTTSSDVTIFNNTIYTIAANQSAAIQLNPGINNSNVSNNILNTTGFQSYGIFPAMSHYNTFANNIIITGGESSDGFDSPGNSSFNVFHNNTITTYGEAGGIDLVWGAHDNNVTNNTINTYGADSSALELTENAYNNTLHGNTIILHDSTSIGVDTDGVLFNTISYSTFTGGLYDIETVNSSGIVLFGNVFASNSRINIINSTSTWSFGGIGNRWTAFDQPTEGCEDSNSNGICDSAYTVATGVTDDYPLALVTGAVTSTPSSPGGGSTTSSSSTTATSIPVETPDEPQTYEATTSQVSGGYTKILKKNDKINFSIFDLEGGRHLLTLNEIGTDYVDLTIESDPINVRLGIGQSTKLNLTSPNYYDLFIRLENITNGEAELTIQTINEPIEKTVETEIVEKEVVVDYFWVVMVLVGLLIIVFFVTVKRNKSKKLKGKESSKKKREKSGKGKKIKA